MRLAAGWLAVAVAALAAAAALPLQGDQRQRRAGGDPQQRKAQQPPSPPANKSEEIPSSLVDVVMQLAVDLSRLAMELHQSGGSRKVSAHRLDTSNESYLMVTFHRSAEAAGGSLTPEGQVRHTVSALTSREKNVEKRDDVAGRVVDYESSAEASLSDPLPLTIKPLPPPLVPVADPPLHVAESSSSAVVTANEVRGQKERVGGQKQQSKKGAEVSKVSQTVALLSHREDEDPYGLRFLLHFLEAIHEVVDAVKSLVSHLGGSRGGGSKRGEDGSRVGSGRSDDGRGDSGGGASGGRGGGARGGGGQRRGADGKGKRKPASGLAWDVADKVASLLGVLEQTKDAQAGKQASAGHKARDRSDKS